MRARTRQGGSRVSMSRSDMEVRPVHVSWNVLSGGRAWWSALSDGSEVDSARVRAQRANVLPTSVQGTCHGSVRRTVWVTLDHFWWVKVG